MAHAADDQMVLVAREATDLLQQLPPRCRAAAMLYFVDGWSQVEIAEHLGITPGAVAAHVRDARKALQPLLRPLHLVRLAPTVLASAKPQAETLAAALRAAGQAPAGLRADGSSAIEIPATPPRRSTSDTDEMFPCHA